MATIHYFLLFICIGAHFICPMNDASGASLLKKNKCKCECSKRENAESKRNIDYNDMNWCFFPLRI